MRRPSPNHLAVVSAPKPAPLAERDQLHDAATYCGDVLSQEALSAIAHAATDYVSRNVRNRLADSWSTERCRRLADRARVLLDDSESGTSFGHRTLGVRAYFGAIGAEDAFTHDLQSQLGLTGGELRVATARGLQATGIYLCVALRRDPSLCPSFADVAIKEGKEQARELIVASGRDWAQLAEHVPLRLSTA